jgi:tetratricopeptide (TPR) repeat protein
MKQSSSILALLTALVFFACAGGKTIHKEPRHLTASMKAITQGVAEYDKGCYHRSLEDFFRAHELFSASDQLDGVAMSLNNIGNVYRIIGDMESSVLFLEESYDIYTHIEDHKGMVQVLSNKAAAHIENNRLEDAAKALDTAEEIARKNRIVYIPLLSNQGILFTKQKDYPRAEQTLEEALKKVDPKNFSEYATVNFAFGNLMFESGHDERAVEFYKIALAADRSSGFYNGIADDLAAIGAAYMRLGQNELATNYYKRSIKIYALINNKKEVKVILDKLEHMAKSSGDDISVTLHFVNQWLDGKSQEGPCN